MAVDLAATYLSAMPKKARPQWRKIYLRQWRKHRKLSTEGLAARSGMSPGNISLLERGLQGYSQEGLEKLAKALDCRPGDLLDADPSRDAALLEALRHADDADREQIAEMAQIVVGRRREK